MSDQSNDKSSSNNAQKLGFFALICIVISSMLGGGVDSLPQNTSQSSAVGPIMIAWIIAGFGVYFIANSFRILSNIRPDLKAGIYMYADEGFGKFIGFLVAWGYWVMSIFGNVAFIVILMDAFNYFFPGLFTGGNNFNSIIAGSFLTWGYYYLVLRGVKFAGDINIIGTIARMIPLFIFIAVLSFVFNYHQFSQNFWGQTASIASQNLGSVSSQIIAPMIVALWCFVGIEGAVVLSGRAKDRSNVGKATIIGFVIALVLYILISILPFGITNQHILSEVPNPSTAGVLKMVIGESGMIIMNLGLIISVLVSWLSWTMLCAEIPMVAAEKGTFPSVFAHMNAKGAPDTSLLITSIITQITVFLVYFSNNAWETMYSITTIMVLPAYLSSTLFLFKLCIDKEYIKYASSGKIAAFISGLIGSIFCIFMFYAGGLNYVAAMPIILSSGIPLFIWSRKEQMISDGTKLIFAKKELFYLISLLLLDLIVIILIATKVIKF